jgi:hypothetical protein
MKRLLIIYITGLIFISCNTISLSQRDSSILLKKWQDGSYKSISDQMVKYRNDSLCLNNLVNVKTSLLSNIRELFYDSCMKNNGKVFGNEFYVLEMSTRSESIHFDFYVESKQKEDKVFHYAFDKSFLLLSEKTIKINESHSLESFFKEDISTTCSDYFPSGSFIISHFKNNLVVSKVYASPSKEILSSLAQTIKILGK